MTTSSRSVKKKIRKRPKQTSGSLVLKVRPKSQQRHRAHRAGNRVIMYDPSSKDKVEFKKQCSQYAPKGMLSGAVHVSMLFNMPRAKSHYGTGRNSDKLKGTAPKLHTSKPDIDNLVKFYLDGMTGLFWNDDACVCTIEAEKRYSRDGSVEIEYWSYPE